MYGGLFSWLFKLFSVECQKVSCKKNSGLRKGGNVRSEIRYQPIESIGSFDKLLVTKQQAAAAAAVVAQGEGDENMKSLPKVINTYDGEESAVVGE